MQVVALGVAVVEVVELVLESGDLGVQAVDVADALEQGLDGCPGFIMGLVMKSPALDWRRKFTRA